MNLLCTEKQQLFLGGIANLENKSGDFEKLQMDSSIVELEEMMKRPAIGLAFKLDTTAYGQLTYVKVLENESWTLKIELDSKH